MATTKKAIQVKPTPKKISREEIEKRLTVALADLQTEIGEKKFKQRIKKAGKLLTHGGKKKDKENDKPTKAKATEPKPAVKKSVTVKKVAVSKKTAKA